MLNLHRKVKEKYPTIKFGIMIMKNIPLQDPPATEFNQAKKQVELEIRKSFAALDKKQMRELPPFSYYHKYYKNFKKTYHVLHQCESIATGSRTLPKGPPLVQAMFMAEIKNQLLTAGYDYSALQAPFHVTLSDGKNSFEGMGRQNRVPPKSDILFSTDKTTLGSIICGPDHENRIQHTTTNTLFAIYGVPGIAADQMDNHFKDIAEFVRLLAPGAEIHETNIQ